MHYELGVYRVYRMPIVPWSKSINKMIQKIACSTFHPFIFIKDVCQLPIWPPSEEQSKASRQIDTNCITKTLGITETTQWDTLEPSIYSFIIIQLHLSCRCFGHFGHMGPRSSRRVAHGHGTQISHVSFPYFLLGNIRTVHWKKTPGATWWMIS